MKKLVLCTIMLLLVLGTAGCSKKELFITADDITADTLLAKANGQLQVATIEDFDKSYYNLTELKDFVTNEIKSYNKTTGEEKITFEDVQLRSGKAIMLLSYSGMDQYSAFNEVSAAYFNGGIKDNPLELPATLINTKNESLASTEEVIQNEKYKVLVMNEPYDIIVDGKVKYFSENAKLIDDNKVTCAEEGMTVIVFKP
ncbi:MAG: hypothetical protein K0S01_2303 [Herbinix sp.]|jgi:hypothetical protein|nr:hypothetical protein [Herbinix sp.]